MWPVAKYILISLRNVSLVVLAVLVVNLLIIFSVWAFWSALC